MFSDEFVIYGGTDLSRFKEASVDLNLAACVSVFAGARETEFECTSCRGFGETLPKMSTEEDASTMKEPSALGEWSGQGTMAGIPCLHIQKY